MNQMRCGECGSVNLHMKTLKGRTSPWKDYDCVELLFDHDVRTCEDCDNIVVSSKDILEMDRIIEKSLHLRTKEAINKIGWEVSVIAQKMGIEEKTLQKAYEGTEWLSSDSFYLLQALAHQTKA